MPPSANPSHERLDSWKGIAAFLGRDERTVQRWEKERGLPVHRLPGKRGAVFAYTHELDGWMKPRAASLDAAADDAVLQILPPFASGAPRTPPVVAVVAPARGLWIWGSALAVAIGAVAIFALHSWRHDAIAASAAAPQPASYAGTPRAHELYLQGVFHWNRRTAASLDQAMKSFTEATQADPHYGAAFAGVAETYELMPEFGTMSSTQAYPAALAAAQRAVAEDPNSAAAHRVLAFAEFFWQWHTRAAMAEFDRSLQLDPGNAQTLHWYATVLLTMHNCPRARQLIQHARELDPDSSAILADSLLIDSCLPQSRDAAISGLKTLETAEPAFLSPPHYLTWIDINTSNYDDYIAQLDRVARITASADDIALATAAHAAWRYRDPHELLVASRDAFEQSFAAGRDSGFDVAYLCAALGDTQCGTKYYKAAIEHHDYRVMLWITDLPPAFAVMLRDPEFVAARDALARSTA